MTLRSFIDGAGDPDRTIAVVGDAAGPLEAMLAETFETQSIEVETGLDPEFELETDATDGDVAVLLEDGDPVAASSMLDLYESILAINSDLFVTGARSLGEIELPDVLAGLEDTRLRLRGYPLAHKEKLLLILLSRYIEQRAWRAGAGRIHSAFQRLSRLDDEIGTREVYAELAATDVDVHLYGVDDGTAVDLDATVHTGRDEAYRDGWFVVYEPVDGGGSESGRSARGSIGDAAAAGPAALVCLETERRVWEGFWTTDPERVGAIGDYVGERL